MRKDKKIDLIVVIPFRMHTIDGIGNVFGVKA
jgi:hypothetical protein